MNSIKEISAHGAEKSDVASSSQAETHSSLFGVDNQENQTHPQETEAIREALGSMEGKCECSKHLQDTLLYDDCNSDISSLSVILKSWSTFTSESSENEERAVFFHAFMPEFESKYRIRGVRNILWDQKSSLSIEYGFTIMGMSGGDCKLRVRYCLFKSGDGSKLLATCEVEPPKESWFKKQIQAGVLDWITTCTTNLLKSPTMQPEGSPNYRTWIANMKYSLFHNGDHEEVLRKMVILLVSIFVLYISLRYGTTGHSSNIGVKIDIQRIDQEYEEYRTHRSAHIDKSSINKLLARLDEAIRDDII